MIRKLALLAGEGRRELGDMPRSELPALAGRRRDGYVWVALVDPDPAEIEEFARLFGLHPLAVADAVSGRQQPKIQAYQDHLFIVLWGLMEGGGLLEVAIVPTFIFVREGVLVTVQRQGMGSAPDLGPILEDAVGTVGSGAVGGLYAIMRSFVEVYTRVADRIETELEVLEAQVFDERLRERDRRIYALRKRIGRIQRAISGLSVALQASGQHLAGLRMGHERIEPYFRDLIEDLAATNQLVNDQDRALDGVLASHQNNVSIRQNSDMRKISAYAALLSVPAVLSALFSFSFQYMPGVDWPYSWEVVVAAIIVIDVLLFVAFKRRDWL